MSHKFLANLMLRRIHVPGRYQSDLPFIAVLNSVLLKPESLLEHSENVESLLKESEVRPV